MIFKIVYALRVIAVCLIAFFLLAYILKWNIDKEIVLITSSFFLLGYVIMSMIAVFVRFRQIHRKPSKTIPQETPETIDTPK
jgi:biotin transporter BioY